MRRGREFFAVQAKGRSFFGSFHPVKGWHGGWGTGTHEMEKADLSETISGQRSKLTGRRDKGEDFEIIEFKLVEVARHPRRSGKK